MENITYHKATIHDIDTLVENRILFSLEFSGPQPDYTIDKLRSQMKVYFKKAMTENTCISYIAICDVTVAGIGSIAIREQPGNFKNPSGRWGYVMNMYTLPAYRRKGICSAILKALVDDAEKMGITAFELHATPAGEFVYKQNGFEIHSEPTYRKLIHR